MMFLFRSTFISAVSAFVIALCLFSMSASAVPQFGRPMLHALDAVTTSSGPVEAVPTPAAASTGTATSSSVSSTATTTSAASSINTHGTSSTATTAPAASSTSTSGASRSLCGGMSVVLGVVVSGVWLVF
ncbi:hypothetical protein BDR05DRAFT_1063695 [Suillus weaverae]|nr:hypothetical protein BDR05DRAFT_1063695 [Suillus weaverae]